MNESTTVSDTAFILHARPYTDSKEILELFSLVHGRVPVVHRIKKKSRSFGGNQQFILYSVSWSGRGSLKTLQTIEQSLNNTHHSPTSTQLFCALYLNEVLIRALQPMDCHGELFLCYQKTLEYLFQSVNLERPLREFELYLLQELGYGIEFSLDSEGVPIRAGVGYRFVVGEGFMRLDETEGLGVWFKGEDLVRIIQGGLDDPSILKITKTICRIALPQIIGCKPLKSKELFL